MDEKIDPEIILTFDEYVNLYGAIDATDPHVVAVRIVEDIENQSPQQRMSEKQRADVIAEYERLVPLYIKFSAENQQAQPQPQPQPQAVREQPRDFDPGPKWFGSSLKLAFPKSVDGAGAALASHPGFLDTGAASAFHPGFLDDTGAAAAFDFDFDHDDFLNPDAALTSGLDPPDATDQFTQMLKSCGLDSSDTEAYEEFMKLLKLKLIDSQHPLNQTMMDVFKQFMTVWTIELKQLLYTKKKGKFTPTPDDTESYKNALLCTAQSFFKKRATASGFHDRMTTRVAIFNTDRPETLLDRAKKIDMFVITVSDSGKPGAVLDEEQTKFRILSLGSLAYKRVSYEKAETGIHLKVNMKVSVPPNQSQVSRIGRWLQLPREKMVGELQHIPIELAEDPCSQLLVGHEIFSSKDGKTKVNLENLDQIFEHTEHFEYMLQVEELSSDSNRRDRIKCIAMILKLLDEIKSRFFEAKTIEETNYLTKGQIPLTLLLHDESQLFSQLEQMKPNTDKTFREIFDNYTALVKCHKEVMDFSKTNQPLNDDVRGSFECAQEAFKKINSKYKSSKYDFDRISLTTKKIRILEDKTTPMEVALMNDKKITNFVGAKCTVYAMDDTFVQRGETLYLCIWFQVNIELCEDIKTSSENLFSVVDSKMAAAAAAAAAAEKAAKKKASAAALPVKAVQVANPPIPPIQAASNAPVQAASNAPPNFFVKSQDVDPDQNSSAALSLEEFSVPPVKKAVKKAAVIVKEEAPVQPTFNFIVEMRTLKGKIIANLQKCQEFSKFAALAVTLDKAKQANVEARQACDLIIGQTGDYIDMIRARRLHDKSFSAVDAYAAQAAAEKYLPDAKAAAEAAEAAAQALQTLADRNAKRRSDMEALTAAIESKRIEDEASTAAEFENLFACPAAEMAKVADQIKRLSDGEILDFFHSRSDLTKYMTFNPTFTRTFLVVGILQERLNKNHSILVTGKTALQLTAVVNDVAIVGSPQAVSVDQLTAPGVCIFKPCSDFDISLVSTVTATNPLKKAFLDTFLLFFDTDAGSLQNFDSHFHENYANFLRTPNAFLTVRTVNVQNTMTVKKSLGHGKKLDVLDVKFLTVEENKSVFPVLNPNTIQLDATGLLRTDVLLQSPQNVHDIKQEQKVLHLIDQYRKFIQEPGVIYGNAKDIAEKLELFLFLTAKQKPGHEERQKAREDIARDVELYYIPIRPGIVLSNQPGPQQPRGVILAVQQALADTNDEQADINFLLEQQQQEEQTAAQRPDGAAAPHVLNFSFPDLPSFLHECVQITIRELTKLLGNKNLSQIENYFFTMSTLLKFFSRAVQLSYIISGKSGGVTSTRHVFDRAVASFGPHNQELNDIIIAILHLFLIDDNTLNPDNFRQFATYKETGKPNSKIRQRIPLHEQILKILTRFKFNLPDQDRMGGKKNKLKTKRKAMKTKRKAMKTKRKAMKTRKTRKTRKIRKTRKTNKSKQNNKKKRFTRNISPYKLANKSRGRRTRKY